MTLGRVLVAGVVLCCACADVDGTADTSSGASEETGAAFEPDPSWRRWEVRADAYAVPADETTYACFGASFELDALAHVVAFEPILDDVSVVHHMIVSRVDDPIDLIEPCYPAPPAATMLWGWGPGGDALALPEVAGLLVGEAGPTVHLVVQIHYGNPLGQGGHRDSSGVALYTSDVLRPEHAAVWGLGEVATLLIPPGWPEWETVHYCAPESSAQLLGEPVHVFGSWLHAHELGRRLWTEQHRDGTFVGELGRQDPYSIDTQRFEVLDATVEPGDALFTHCVYDSTSRTEVTYGGGATDDEMCLNYLLYYPAQPLLGYCND
jgi:hypothetical protein